MDEHRHLQLAPHPLGEAGVVGMDVREHHRLDVAQLTADRAQAGDEDVVVAGKAGIDQRQAARFLDDVPVEGIGREVVHAGCDFHDKAP